MIVYNTYETVYHFICSYEHLGTIQSPHEVVYSAVVIDNLISHFYQLTSLMLMIAECLLLITIDKNNTCLLSC